MRKYHGVVRIFSINLLLIIILGGCGSTPPPTYTTGDPVTHGVGGVSFLMHYIQGGLTFASDDDAINGTTDVYPDEITVINAYWLAQTEVTYELWSAVRAWGFTHSYDVGGGMNGNDGSGSEQQPVTHVSWRDAVVFCNALTVYHNATKGTNYDCVYYADAAYATPIQSDSDPNIDTPYIKASSSGNTAMANCIAKGFRLPTSDEWELAARYRDGSSWTPGNYASGATDWIFSPNPPFLNPDQSATVAVAVYDQSSTAEVKSKNNNALGLYDMSGNVSEWCFEWHPQEVDPERMLRGGGWWDSPASIQLGRVTSCAPSLVSSSYGIRLARTR